MSTVFQGQVVPLSLQLEDGATGMYPRAVVRDETGAAVAGSPFDLTDRGDGLYTSTALSLGAQDSLHATYIVYTDAGHTTESDEHLRATDVFHRADLPDEGKWEITNTGGGTLYIYASDNTTLLASFELYDETGARTTDTSRIVKRVRI